METTKTKKKYVFLILNNEERVEYGERRKELVSCGQ